jgi:hypothetical protein
MMDFFFSKDLLVLCGREDVRRYVVGVCECMNVPSSQATDSFDC